MSIVIELQSNIFGSIILLLLFVLSLVGYYCFLRLKRLHPAFIPGAIVSFLICCVYTAGLLNVMLLITFFLFSAGCVLFFIFCPKLVKTRKQLPNNTLSLWIVLFLTAVCAYFFVILHNSLINGYDDYSHWATMVKSLLANDRLPRFSEDYIMFSSYPPGSACFIYYFCRIAGNREGYYLFAQYLLKISFLCPLFCLCRNEKAGKILPTAACAVILLLSVHNISAHTLSVDGLLSCCGIFCFLSVYYVQENPRQSLVLFALGSSTCILIKNSGIFFYAAALFYIFFTSGTYRTDKNFSAFFKRILIYITPLLVLFLWQRHVAYAFENGLNAKHSMSVSHYLNVISEKTSADITEELKIIMSRIFNPSSDHLLWILAGFVIVTLLLIGTKHQSHKKLLILLALLVVIYEAGVLGMYVFSMPHKEVISQNGKDYLRYNGTLVTFMAGMLFIYAASCFSYLKKVRKVFVLLIPAVCIILSLYPRLRLTDLDPTLKHYATYANRVEAKKEAEVLLKEIPSLSETKILVRVDPVINKANYVKYMMRYLLLGTDFKITTLEDDTEFSDYWKKSKITYCIDLIDHTILQKDAAQ